MNQKSVYITINHLEDFSYLRMLRPQEVLLLKKDRTNCYDDEAVAVYSKQQCKCGYIANSVSTVARGTYSAGRIYDKITDDTECRICFITGDVMIAEIIEKDEGNADTTIPAESSAVSETEKR